MSSEWQPKVFSDLVDFVSEKAQAKDTNLATYISTENMEPNFGGVKTAATLPKSGSVTKFKVSDTLFSNIRTYFKKVWEAEFNGHCSNDVLVFRSKDKNKLLPSYLHNLCRWERFTEFSVRTSKGAKMPRGDKDALIQFQFELPPLEAQLAVSEFLDALDDRITLLHETNTTLEAIAQALFKSWFVDFDPVRAKQEGRAPQGMDEATATSFPDSFEESELGLVPRGWKVSNVGDVINVTDYVANGSFASLKENVTLQDMPGYALYLRTTDYNSGFAGDFRYVDKAAYNFLSKSSLDGSEVVISNVGDVGTVFRPPIWLGLPMTLGSNAVALKNTDMSAYLYFYFSGPKGQHDIQSIVTGSAQLKFNKTNFRALRMAIPDAGCLSIFEGIANTLLSRIDYNSTQIQTLTSLRNTLLPRLISGQLRLPEADSSVEEVR